VNGSCNPQFISTAAISTSHRWQSIRMARSTFRGLGRTRSLLRVVPSTGKQGASRAPHLSTGAFRML
jgi:hypothetical protein